LLYITVGSNSALKVRLPPLDFGARPTFDRFDPGENAMPAKPSNSNFASALLLTICTFFLFATGATAADSNNHRRDGVAAQAVATDTYGKLPLSFEPNQGQTDQQVKFLSRGPGYALFLTPAEAVFTLRTPTGKPTRQKSLLPISAKPFEHEPAATKYSVLRIGLEHANNSPRISGTEELPGKSNYFVGKDPKNWHSNIPTYRKVKYSGVYRGVDLVYYGNQRQLEYDFIVAPGADPNVISLRFTGARRLSIDKDGDLVAQLRGGNVIEHAPLIYQEIDGVHRPVAGGYQLKRGHTVGFKLAAYDHRKRLTIDPSLVYSTYLGGNGYDFGFGITVDSSGNAYVAGQTGSSNFPTTAGALHTTSGGGADAFVSKLNNDGSALVILPTWAAATSMLAKPSLWTHQATLTLLASPFPATFQPPRARPRPLSAGATVMRSSAS
jgi:hypothetical protein